MGVTGSCQLFLLLAVSLDPTAAVSDTGLQCPLNTLDAEVDETVILPCRTTPKMDVVNKVEWVVNDTVDVYLLRNGKPELDDQGTDFKEITSLFDDELSSGNCSLRLKTKMSHSGRYRCTVRTANKTKSCHISLTVRPRKGSNTTPLTPSDGINTTHNTNPHHGSGTPPGGGDNSTLLPGGIVGIVIGVIIGIGVIIVVILLVIWKRKMSSEGCDGMRSWPFPFPRPLCCPPAGEAVRQSDPDDPAPPTEDRRTGDQDNRANEIQLEDRIVDPNPPGDP
ncbi:uncharacterized protein LOC116695357 [Etheostoma spectabile]|uniref:uncharacterized protein LOC116695357 n=1 Tax=Etheostoma spectabile TaxID=54343 RepID=UPI0013AE927F|nr:uncharacterized protein LOC116695357 [Etheostoma spectabile]